MLYFKHLFRSLILCDLDPRIMRRTATADFGGRFSARKSQLTVSEGDNTFAILSFETVSSPQQ
jgi:hypothetical protein